MIVLIEGSPRKEGNGAHLAGKIAQKYANEDVKRMRLYDMSYKGCSSCRKCREQNTFCVLDDDMAGVYPLLAAADRIIIIAPSFYGHVNGEVKQFIDRLYCMKKADKTGKYKEGCKLVFLFTQGSPQRDRGAAEIEWMKKIAENSQLKYYGLTVPNCSFDDVDGIRLKEEEIMMSISFFA